MVKEESKELVSCLSKETVIVKFIKRQKGRITDPKHVAYGGMLDSAEKVLVPKKLRNGKYTNILTDSEKAFLEDYLGLERDALSIYRNHDNYWNNFRIRLTKDDTRLDLSNPDDYIKYKVLLSNDNLVAPGIDNIPHKATYLYVLIKEGELEKRKVRKLTNKQEAFKLFGKIEDNKEALKYLLRAVGKVTSKTTKLGTLQGWVGDYIDSDADLVVKVLHDKYLATKILINQATDLGVLSLRNDEYYDNQSQKPLATGSKKANINTAAAYLNEPRHQEVKLSIQARVDNAKE